MPRALLLLLLVLWPAAGGRGDGLTTASFLAGFALPGLAVAVTVRRARRSAAWRRATRRVLLAGEVGLLVAVGWLGVGLIWFGWAGTVRAWVPGWWGIGALRPVVGVTPVLVGWAVVWAAAHPAWEVAAGRTMLERVEAGLPVRRFPSRWRFVAGEMRDRVLVLLAPVTVLLMLRDVLRRAGLAAGWSADVAEAVGVGGGVVAVLLLGPVVLRRVLRTRPLPAGELRERLEALVATSGVRVRRLLLWDTDFQRPNALALGLVRPTRYVLLSDALIELLSDRQLDAVLAHELGHVRHRHLVWLLSLGLGLMLIVWGPASRADQWVLARLPAGVAEVAAWGTVALTLLLVALAFTAAARAYEREADRFAHRVAGQGDDEAVPAIAEALAVVTATPEGPPRVRVGPAGWLLDVLGNPMHGSTRQRVAALRDPRRIDRNARIARTATAAVLLLGLLSLPWA